jgi:hypothetical protein
LDIIMSSMRGTMTREYHPTAAPWLLVLLAAGYLALESESIFRGLAPRPMALLYGYEPWIRQSPPQSLLPAPPVLFDEVLQFLPWQELTRRELAAGRMPLWNPYQYCGAPHLGASQPAVLSPFTLLGLPRSAFFQHLARFAGFATAGAGTYAWLAAAGLGTAACWLGAVSFAFCGFLTLWAGHPHFLSAVWLPLVLLGVEQMARGRRLPVQGEPDPSAGSASQARSLRARGTGFVTVALAVGASLLGGHVETSLHLALVAAVYALGRAPRTLPWLLGAVAFGTGLAAAALLPFFEYLLQSSALAARQAGFETARALPWRALACLLVPEALGGEPFGAFRLDRFNLNEVAGGFAGPVVLALAFSARRSPVARPALAVVGVSLLLAFEPWPVGPVAAHLPLLGLAYNGRLLLAVALMVSALGAAGLDAVRSGRAGAGPGFLAVAAGIAVIGVLGRGYLSIASTMVPLGSLACAFLLLRRPAVALIAVAALPALRLGVGYHGGAPAQGAWPALELPAGRFAALGRLAFPAEIATAYGLRDIRGYDAMTPRRIEELFARVEPLVEQEGRLGIFRLRALSRWAGPLYDFLGVRVLYVGRGAEPPPPEAGFRPLGGGFWARDSGPGRAFFTARAIVLPDEEAVLRYVASEAFDPAVPAFAGPVVAPPADAAAEPPHASPVRFLLDDPAEVLLEVEAPEEGFVVLADTDFPGWRVFVDGRPAAGLRANYAFRAVKVPRGPHQVRWIYRPESFLAGALVSSIFLGLVVIWLSFGGGEKRNGRTTPC